MKDKIARWLRGLDAVDIGALVVLFFSLIAFLLVTSIGTPVVTVNETIKRCCSCCACKE